MQARADDGDATERSAVRIRTGAAFPPRFSREMSRLFPLFFPSFCPRLRHSRRSPRSRCDRIGNASFFFPWLHARAPRPCNVLTRLSPLFPAFSYAFPSLFPTLFPPFFPSLFSRSPGCRSAFRSALRRALCALVSARCGWTPTRWLGSGSPTRARTCASSSRMASSSRSPPPCTRAPAPASTLPARARCVEEHGRKTKTGAKTKMGEGHERTGTQTKAGLRIFSRFPSCQPVFFFFHFLPFPALFPSLPFSRSSRTNFFPRSLVPPRTRRAGIWATASARVPPRRACRPR